MITLEDEARSFAHPGGVSPSKDLGAFQHIFTVGLTFLNSFLILKTHPPETEDLAREIQFSDGVVFEEEPRLNNGTKHPNILRMSSRASRKWNIEMSLRYFIRTRRMIGVRLKFCALNLCLSANKWIHDFWDSEKRSFKMLTSRLAGGLGFTR